MLTAFLHKSGDNYCELYDEDLACHSLWVFSKDVDEVLKADIEEAVYAATRREAIDQFEVRFPVDGPYDAYRDLLTRVHYTGDENPVETVHSHRTAIVRVFDTPTVRADDVDWDQQVATAKDVASSSGPVMVQGRGEDKESLENEGEFLEEGFVPEMVGPGLILITFNEKRARRKLARRRAAPKPQAITISDIQAAANCVACDVPFQFQHSGSGMDGAVRHLADVLAIHKKVRGPFVYRHLSGWQAFLKAVRATKDATFKRWRHFPDFCDFLRRELRAREPKRSIESQAWGRRGGDLPEPFDPREYSETSLAIYRAQVAEEKDRRREEARRQRQQRNRLALARRRLRIGHGGTRRASRRLYICKCLRDDLRPALPRSS